MTIDAPSGGPRLEAEAFADLEEVAKVSNNLPLQLLANRLVETGAIPATIGRLERP